jgi:hypothetical protein
VVVVVSVVVVPGVEVAMGVAVSFGVLVVVVVVVSLVAGVGFTIVVLVWSGAGDAAAGAVVSVRCSQAAKSAALARMQMYFFIIVRIECPYMG